MHLKAVFKGILKRSNSSPITVPTRSSSSSNSNTAEPFPRPDTSNSAGHIQDSTAALPVNVVVDLAKASSRSTVRFGDKHSVQDSILEEHITPDSDSQSQSQSESDVVGEAKLDSDIDSDHNNLSEKLDLNLDHDHDSIQTPPRPARHGDGVNDPTLLIHCPSPDHSTRLNNPDQESDSEHTYYSPEEKKTRNLSVEPAQEATSPSISPATIIPPTLPPPTLRPVDTNIRRQSLVNGANTRIIRTLLDSAASNRPFSPITPAPTADYFGPAVVAANMASILTRKIWVKRPGASATMVSIREDDLVDDVRDMILRKYANSLGRSFDSPDVTLRIVTRAATQRSQAERLLGPEEDMCKTLDQYYPGGQTVDEALIIDVPQRVKTPRPSPRAYNHNSSYAALDEFRPPETGTDYFPQMPAVIPPSGPHSAVGGGPVHHPALHADQARSMSVLSTGQLPPLPSPGLSRRHREHRPKFSRQHTSSPTILSHPHPSNIGNIPVNSSNLAVSHNPSVRTGNRPRVGSSASDQHPNGAPSAPPLPTPPAPEAPPTGKGSSPPTPAPREKSTLRPGRPKRSRKPTPTDGTPIAGPKSAIGGGKGSSLFDGSMPPINVLIVEDNIINLKLLEAFMKRLKVRWSTAMNGQIAVNKWRAGGFHLVLMDIQLPIMSGLEATKEIRRLERVNGIGVFSNSTPTTEHPMGKPKMIDANAPERDEQQKEDDKLNKDEGQFKSPVIIVALTASSLQSDRHEALAAGCNDFLTKPVNFVWLERKVSEWGCMQALIDFDGWRQWKDFASSSKDTATKALPASAADPKAKDKKIKRTSRASLETNAKPPPTVLDTAASTASNTWNGEETPTDDA